MIIQKRFAKENCNVSLLIFLHAEMVLNENVTSGLDPNQSDPNM